MSSNLTAEPINRKKLNLGTSLKFALRKKYGEPVNIVMCNTNLSFIEGLIAGGNDELSAEAQKLYQYIEKYGEVLIKEEY